MVDSRPPERSAGTDPESRRLGSWKEIARHLGRTVRTVQRWEKTLDLPVRRLQQDGGASVFAYTHELDRWLTRRSLVVHEGQGAAAPAAPSTPDPETAADTPPTMLSERARRRYFVYGLAAVAALVIAAVYTTTRVAAPPPEPVGHLVPRHLTTDSGIERFPALSPDGRQVVYTWDGGDGQVDLYLRLVDVEEHIRLTDDAAIEESPAWSPDGLSIAFLRRDGPARRELRIVRALGGQDRVVTAFAVPASLDAARSISAAIDWSPDGRWIVYTPQGDDPESMRLSVIDIATGGQIDLTDPEEGVSDLCPRFSPDGRLLAWARSPSALTGSIHVMEFGPESPHPGRSWRLPDATPWNSEPAWTADGRDLVFSSGRWPRTGLWRMPADGSAAPQPLTGTSQGGSQPTIARLQGPGGEVQAAAWRVVYPVIELENDIWEIDLQESAKASPLLRTSQRERFPSFAADGRIAFLSDRSGSREIWVASPDGKDWQQWTEWQSAYVWRPSFAPDMTLLAYTVEIDHVNRLHVQDGPLAPARDLSGGIANDEDLAWSRDSRRIYVASTNRGSEGRAVWAVPLDGPEPALVVPGPFLPLGESPDGRWLFLHEPGAKQSHLRRLDLASGILHAVVLDGDGRHSFTLGPDGVYFVGQFGEGWEIHRWDWRSGEQVRVQRLDHEPEVGMAISPDGRRALLARISLLRSDLMVAEAQY